MDVRYNMINWVHRSTRGWSYGGGITDPRTGEIIKGNVTLGSLRVRQDFMIGAGLIPQYAEGDDPRACLADMSPDPDYLVALDGSTDVTAMSLARIRQLAAHETGHTLGFAHNFAASSYGRASVMDYPAPWVEIIDGKLDLSHAYATGIGEFDKFAVRYAYSQFAPEPTKAQALEQHPRGRRGARHAVHHRLRCASGQRRASAREPVGQRRGSDRDAQARDGSAPDRALAVRPDAPSRSARRCRSSS